MFARSRVADLAYAPGFAHNHFDEFLIISSAPKRQALFIPSHEKSPTANCSTLTLVKQNLHRLDYILSPATVLRYTNMYTFNDCHS
jgi:hypothetical protein